MEKVRGLQGRGGAEMHLQGFICTPAIAWFMTHYPLPSPGLTDPSKKCQ